ncbi:clotting factor B-like [Centruroides vittatus]|uniref:clotting factor B-like n=1 Tax=Centruroides vittatus TaxID=120091 RepID=UPI00350FF3EE
MKVVVSIGLVHFLLLVTAIIKVLETKQYRSHHDGRCRTSWGENGTCRHVTMCEGRVDTGSVCYWFHGSPHVCCIQEKLSRRSAEVPHFRQVGCGEDFDVKNAKNTRIVGGVPAGSLSKQGWPWMAQVFFRMPGRQDRFFCGGSVITSYYILSAAHCFDFGLTTDYFVRVGSHIAGQGTRHDLLNIYQHENYRRGEFYDDIAVLEVTEEINLNGRVAPICLPSPRFYGDSLVGRDVTVAGWGLTSFAGFPSSILREVSVPVVPNSKCQNAYGRAILPTISRGITEKMICAGVDEGGKDSCQGDSGGPLVLEDGGKWMLVGIVSFGYKCAEPGYPGVYTRVVNYLRWLADNTDITQYA